MKKFLFIAIVMISSLGTTSIANANTPCCNSKMNHCTKCSKTCDKNICMDYCSNVCKSSGNCNKTCK